MRKAALSSSAGFSLFEIVVAMVILGLITTSIFSIVWQAGDTAAEIRSLDKRGEEVERFVSLLRETIEGLPPEAGFTITPAEDSGSGYHELFLENTPTSFTFGELVGSCEEAYIALRPGEILPTGEQGFDLALSRSDFLPDDSDGSGMAFRVGSGALLDEDEDGRYWLPLLTGIRGASWRFWDDDSQEWLEEWTDEEKLPPLMEFSLLDRDSSVPVRLVYEVPDRLVDPEAAAAIAQASEDAQLATTEVVSSSAAAPSGRGGDGQGRGGDGQGRGGDGQGRGGDGQGRGGDGQGRGGDGQGRGGDGQGRGGDGQGRGGDGQGRGGDGQGGGPGGGQGVSGGSNSGGGQ
ncbi:MAG: prepilin-type N-terminal cleavage/methylation domain-containing protein [Verrucomicrobiales bacterium]|nr:prepilin-type N-terminal cleavage/methylation domain-containing protein [Verrucomicrobiales bacterium]